MPWHNLTVCPCKVIPYDSFLCVRMVWSVFSSGLSHWKGINVIEGINVIASVVEAEAQGSSGLRPVSVVTFTNKLREGVTK